MPAWARRFVDARAGASEEVGSARAEGGVLSSEVTASIPSDAIAREPKEAE